MTEEWTNAGLEAALGGDYFRSAASDLLEDSVSKPVFLEEMASVVEATKSFGFSFEDFGSGPSPLSLEFESPAQAAMDYVLRTGRSLAFPRYDSNALSRAYQRAPALHRYSGIAFAAVDLGSGSAIAVPVQVTGEDSDDEATVYVYPVVDEVTSDHYVIKRFVRILAVAGTFEVQDEKAKCAVQAYGKPRCNDNDDCECQLFEAFDDYGQPVFVCDCS